MQTPKVFELTGVENYQKIVDEHPFATLIHSVNEGDSISADAQHIPFYWHCDKDGNHYLHGHIARANTLWQHSLASPTALCVFQGPQAYITPNWYPTKQQHGKAVPTWNYVVVHIRGTVSFIHDKGWLESMLVTLTEKMENNIEKGQKTVWQLSDAPQEYIQKMLAGIVGLEIAIESIEAQCKLSQNQPAVNHEGVIQGLQKSSQIGAAPMVKIMQLNKIESAD